ncbi:MAG: formate dehydrogenase subunit delta [Pseudomonadota bacterium]
MSRMQTDELVELANSVVTDLADWGDESVVAEKAAVHIRRFWTPTMRAQLEAYYRTGGEDLNPTVQTMLENHSIDES